MSTKINETYYGAENTFVDLGRTYVKRSPYNIGDLFTNGNYTGGALDKTAAPWGIGKSSASSDFEYIAQKGATWTIEKLTRKKGNTPLFLYINSGLALGARSNSDLVGTDNTSINYEKALFKCRISPEAENDGGTLKSTLTFDSGDNVSIADTLSNFPITYLDYQHVRLYIDHVYYKPVGSNTIEKCTMNDIEADRVYVDYIVYFDCYLSYDSATGTTPDTTSVHCSIGGNEVDIAETFKNVYYSDNNKFVRPWRYIERFGYWYISTNWYNNDDFRYTTTDSINYKSAWETMGNNDFVYASPVNCGWSHLSDIQQDFNGLKYHWNSGLTVYNANPWEINEIKTGDAFASGTYRSFAYLEVDEIPEGMSKNEAYFNAVLHECAFLGFPIVLNHISVYHSFGDNDVYLPVFDEHLITTGDFKSGAESLLLTCAQWGDIFGSSMPEYDPEYDPDPKPDTDDDIGYLNNFPTSTHIYSNNYNVYLLDSTEYNAFIRDVNSLYLTDPDGYEQFQLDFKGTNPNDYIIGVYGYPFMPCVLEENQPSINIELGAVLLPNAQGCRILPSNVRNVKSLGVIDLTGGGDYFKPFGDFRDFEPYTSIDLYVPLCGCVNLDPAQVIGHTLYIYLWYDIMTGNATAAIYRDNLTLIKTISGQVGATLPLTAARMGDYQNAVKTTEMALRQNELKAATSAATVAIGIGAAMLAPETGGLSLAAGAAAITGASGLMSSAMQHSQLEYDLKHKQPQLTTVSSANGSVAQNISTMYAVCYVKQCKMLSTYNAETYAHTIGHACVINTTIGDEVTESKNSYIVCGNTDLSGIPATAAEINAIQSLLTGGVYV